MAFYENDPYAAHQWGLENTGQNGGTVGCDVNADSDAITISDDAGEQVIALVDTGIAYDHPDLADRMWENPFAGTGTLEGTCGYNFVDMTDDPLDDNGHGTHCAGIMAASVDDAQDVAGVVSGDQVKLMALKIFDAEWYSYEFAEFAAYHYIYQAQQLNVNVVAVNDSWGYGAIDEWDDGFTIFETLINLVGENGALSIMAAGNDGMDCDTNTVLPSTWDSPYMITVAASDEQDRLALFPIMAAKM
ncbi:MAG: S8 family serine peptidase [Ruminococcus sp.]|nr:S8 family serine peptidase [Ruminococcus sp.]